MLLSKDMCLPYDCIQNTHVICKLKNDNVYNTRFFFWQCRISIVFFPPKPYRTNYIIIGNVRLKPGLWLNRPSSRLPKWRAIYNGSALWYSASKVRQHRRKENSTVLGRFCSWKDIQTALAIEFFRVKKRHWFTEFTKSYSYFKGRNITKSVKFRSPEGVTFFQKLQCAIDSIRYERFSTHGFFPISDDLSGFYQQQYRSIDNFSIIFQYDCSL